MTEKFTILSATLYAVLALTLVVALIAPISANAISRIDSRTEAANQRTAGTGDQGGSGGTGGSNGGQSGGSSSESQSSDVNVNPDAAQELFDEIILGSTEDMVATTTEDIINGTEDEGMPSWGGDPDTGDTEEQVATTDARNPGFGFSAFFNTTISRFRSH